MTHVASIANLTVSDGTTKILDRVDLELDSGTVTGLVGASGVGKTTLARVILGHVGAGLHKVSGEVRVDGHDPFTRPGRRGVRGRSAAFLPQDPGSALDPARTIVAQLHTVCRIAHPGASRIERREVVRDAARDAALEPELLRRRPLQLSGGQAQRALLAWILVTRPRLLILDEPTSSLDPETALEVSRTFANLPWEPAVLLVSHDRDLIGRVSDRILEINGGRLHPREVAPPRAAPVCVPSPAGSPDPPVLQAKGLTIVRSGHVIVRDPSTATRSGRNGRDPRPHRIRQDLARESTERLRTTENRGAARS